MMTGTDPIRQVTTVRRRAFSSSATDRELLNSLMREGLLEVNDSLMTFDEAVKLGLIDLDRKLYHDTANDRWIPLDEVFNRDVGSNDAFGPRSDVSDLTLISSTDDAIDGTRGKCNFLRSKEGNDADQWRGVLTPNFVDVLKHTYI